MLEAKGMEPLYQSSISAIALYGLLKLLHYPITKFLSRLVRKAFVRRIKIGHSNDDGSRVILKDSNGFPWYFEQNRLFPIPIRCLEKLDSCPTFFFELNQWAEYSLHCIFTRTA